MRTRMDGCSRYPNEMNDTWVSSVNMFEQAKRVELSQDMGRHYNAWAILLGTKMMTEMQRCTREILA